MAKVNKHGLKMVGLRHVAGQSKHLEGCSIFTWKWQVFYNIETGEISFYEVDMNSSVVFTDEAVITVGRYWKPFTMQQLADYIAAAVDRHKEDAALLELIRNH